MKMYINGTACDASDGKTIDVINPATGEVIDTVPSATKEDVDRAVEVAVEGQKRWAKDYPVWKRIELFQKFMKLAEENRKEIAMTLCRESGRAIREAYGDFDWVFRQTYSFSAAAQCMLGGTTLPLGSEGGKENDFDITIREPLGVIVGILPFNDPINHWSKKVVPALLCGNSMVLKPASDDPLAAIQMTELAYEAGIPGDVMQIITGRGEQCGEWLSTNPKIAGITLTGSCEVGLKVANNLSKGLKYQSLELGGNAPMIVCDDADIDLAVEEAVIVRVMPRNGQACNTTKRFLLPESLKDEFIEKLVKRIEKFKIGDPTDWDTEVGTLISERAAKEVEAQVNLTISQGAKLVHGNKRNGAYYPPTVLDNCDSSMDIAHDMEVFGPVFPIFTYDNIESAIALANDTQYGLASSVFSRNYPRAFQIATRIEAGSVTINGQSSYRNARTAWGGYKLSGYGREGQEASILAMTQEKNIVFKHMMSL